MKKMSNSIFYGWDKNINCACVDYDGTLHLGHTDGNLRITWASGCWRGFDKIYSCENSGYYPETSKLRRGWVWTTKPEFKHVSDLNCSDKISYSVLVPFYENILWEYLFIYPTYVKAVVKMLSWQWKYKCMCKNIKQEK
jgi:hypothetical protein